MECRASREQHRNMEGVWPRHGIAKSAPGGSTERLPRLLLPFRSGNYKQAPGVNLRGAIQEKGHRFFILRNRNTSPRFCFPVSIWKNKTGKAGDKRRNGFRSSRIKKLQRSKKGDPQKGTPSGRPGFYSGFPHGSAATWPGILSDSERGPGMPCSRRSWQKDVRQPCTRKQPKEQDKTGRYRTFGVLRSLLWRVRQGQTTSIASRSSWPEPHPQSNRGCGFGV